MKNLIQLISGVIQEPIRPRLNLVEDPSGVLRAQRGTEAGLMQVSGAGGFSPINISEASFTRPNDTTAYAASECVSNSTSAPALLNFANVLPNAGGDGYIVAARAFTNASAFNTLLRLHLYKVSTITPINDNAAFTLLFANRANRVGFIDFSGWTTGGSGSDAAGTLGLFPGSGSSLPIELASGQTSLWGMVETRAVFTPTAQQQFWFSLKTQQA